MITTDSNMIKAVKILGKMNEKDGESNEVSDIDIEGPGDEFMLITKLKRMACLTHAVQLVYKNIFKIGIASYLLQKARSVVKNCKTVFGNDTGSEMI